MNLSIFLTEFINNIYKDAATWLTIVMMIGGLVVLILGGEFLVRGASNIAYSLQISPLVVGLTIVAFGTSAPELLISTVSALDNKADIAMGNVVGSNICNLALVMGVTAMFYPIVVQKISIKVDWLVTMGSALMLYFFTSQDRVLTRFEGIIFITCLIAYTVFLIQMSRRETREKLAAGLNEDEEIPSIKGKAVFIELAFIALGCVGLFFGAGFFVGGVQVVASKAGVSDATISLTVVALGTSLPELVTSAVAALKKNTDLAMGNLLGSCIFNVLSILGITSIITKVDGIVPIIFERDILWMLGITLLILPMMLTRRKIGRIEGLILLIVYGFYIYQLTSTMGSEETISAVTEVIK